MKQESFFTLIIASFLFFFLSLDANPPKPVAAQADLVIFSYNRPMQLYALLESIEEYVSGLDRISVIYRADADYHPAYHEVMHRFPSINYHLQYNPPADFKELTLQAIAGPAAYLLFAVDDNIVTDYIDIGQCINKMERASAYAFFLRLGKNLDYCYSENRAQPLPTHSSFDDDCIVWQFAHATGDWGYPYTVDMTIYKKEEVNVYLSQLFYPNPNRLESSWAAQAHAIMNKQGIAFNHSKITNIPANRVQTVFNNRVMNSYSPQELLEKFNNGLKIDIYPFFKINNRSAHTPADFIFIKREG